MLEYLKMTSLDPPPKKKFAHSFWVRSLYENPMVETIVEKNSAKKLNKYSFKCKISKTSKFYFFCYAHDIAYSRE
jgi:hypothetical protein